MWIEIKLLDNGLYVLLDKVTGAERVNLTQKDLFKVLEARLNV